MMSTQVSFYIGVEQTVAFVARLINKVFVNQRMSVAFVPNRLADTLDRVLWLSPPTSFVPHVRLPSNFAEDTPIIIVDADRDDNFVSQKDVAINLLDMPVRAPEAYQRILEVVPVDRVAIGRRLYKYYKTQGFTVNHFDMSKEGKPL